MARKVNPITKLFLVTATAFSMAPTSDAADYMIKAGSTNVSVYFFVSDAGGSPTDVAYTRNGDAPQNLTPSTALTNANDPHTDNKWFVVQPDISSMGLSVLRYDLPDDVCAAGKSSVTITLVTDAPAIATLRIDLVGYDPTAANLPANVTQISGDQTAADNAESFFDGTGYGGHVIAGELDNVNTQTAITITLPVSGTMAAENLKDCLILLREGNQKGIRRITASSASYASAELVDLTLDSALPWNVTADATYSVLPPDFRTEDRTSLLAVKTKTDFLPNVTPGTSGGLFRAGTNADTTVNITGNVTGSISGSVGSINGTTFESIHLNRLFATTDSGGIVQDNSLWAKLHSKSTTAAYSDYNNTTDSLQAQRENFDDVLASAPTFAQAMDAQGYTAALAAKLERVGPTLLVSTTIDGAPASDTEFKLLEGPTNDDALNGALVIVTKGTQKAVGIVPDYDASSETVTLVTDLGGFAMADDDEVDIIAGGPVPLWLGAGP